jgi:hypothetical protein
MLTALVPEHTWDPLQFVQRPRHTWSDPALQRRVLQDAAQKLGVRAPSAQWYAVSSRALDAAAGASGLLGAYRRSPAALLAALWPEHAWDAAAFAHKPRRYWHVQHGAHARAWLQQLRARLTDNVADVAWWYSLQRADVLRVAGGAALLAAYGGSLSACIMSAFPEHAWNAMRFPSRSRSRLVT